MRKRRCGIAAVVLCVTAAGCAGTTVAASTTVGHSEASRRTRTMSSRRCPMSALMRSPTQTAALMPTTTRDEDERRQRVVAALDAYDRDPSAVNEEWALQVLEDQSPARVALGASAKASEHVLSEALRVCDDAETRDAIKQELEIAREAISLAEEWCADAVDTRWEC